MAECYSRRLMMRRLPVLLLLLGTTAFSQPAQTVAPVLVRYDVDSTTLTFCTMVGASGNPAGSPVSGSGRILTAGSSTTVTSETASAGALAPVVARDVIIVQRGSTTDTAVVTAKASNDSVTVDAAVNWPGNSYTYLKSTCGTTDNDGWVGVGGGTRIMMTVQYEQGDLDALVWQFQCIGSAVGSKPVVVYPSEGDGCGNSGTQVAGFCEFAAAGSAARFTWEEMGAWSRCRVGVKVKTTDASDAGAALEQVSASVVVSAGSL
jgi:hypothetical protein